MRLTTQAKCKLRYALRRVEEKVLREIRNSIQQQRKRKAKVVAGKDQKAKV